jgi:hypothetical protein
MKEFEQKEDNLHIPSKISSKIRRRNIITSSMEVDKVSRTIMSVDVGVQNANSSMLFKTSQKANKINKAAIVARSKKW